MKLKKKSVIIEFRKCQTKEKLKVLHYYVVKNNFPYSLRIKEAFDFERHELIFPQFLETAQQKTNFF